VKSSNTLASPAGVETHPDKSEPAANNRQHSKYTPIALAHWKPSVLIDFVFMQSSNVKLTDDEERAKGVRTVQAA
jgi:hypothetical protein